MVARRHHRARLGPRARSTRRAPTGAASTTCRPCTDSALRRRHLGVHDAGRRLAAGDQPHRPRPVGEGRVGLPRRARDVRAAPSRTRRVGVRDRRARGGHARGRRARPRSRPRRRAATRRPSRATSWARRAWAPTRPPRWCRRAAAVWDVDNVFVCDSSVFVTVGGLQPDAHARRVWRIERRPRWFVRFAGHGRRRCAPRCSAAVPASWRSQDVPVPAVGDGDVLVEVDLCGVCGSDLHMVLDGWGRKGRWEGHEWVGRIAATGKRRDAVERGRRRRRRAVGAMRRVRTVPRRTSVAVPGARHARRDARPRRVRRHTS